MINQLENAQILNALHIKGNPLIIFNIWDAGSAKALQDIGAKVIGTSSWSVSHAHGYEDGEKLPFDSALTNVQRIVASVDIPVTIDLEGGYGQTPLQVQETVAKIISAGAVGINLEDQIIGGDDLYSCEDQCARIKAITLGQAYNSVPVFINARTDIFLKADATNHNESHLEEAIYRASAYAAAGADGYFVPGLKDERMIQKLCAVSSIPINVMVSTDGPSPKKLAELGVSRISYGPLPYCHVLDNLKEAGRRAFELG